MALTSLTWGFHPHPTLMYPRVPFISALGLQFPPELIWISVDLQFNHSHACDWPWSLLALIPTCSPFPGWPWTYLIITSLSGRLEFLVEPGHCLWLCPACLVPAPTLLAVLSCSTPCSLGSSWPLLLPNTQKLETFQSCTGSLLGPLWLHAGGSFALKWLLHLRTKDSTTETGQM